MQLRSLVIALSLPLWMSLSAIPLELYFGEGAVWVFGLLALLSAMVATIVFFKSSLRLASTVALGWLFAGGLLFLAQVGFDPVLRSVMFKDILNLKAGGVPSAVMISSGLGAVLFLGFKLVQKCTVGINPAVDEESEDQPAIMRQLLEDSDKMNAIPARHAPYLLAAVIAALVFFYFFGRHSLLIGPSDVFLMVSMVLLLGLETFKAVVPSCAAKILYGPVFLILGIALIATDQRDILAYLIAMGGLGFTAYGLYQIIMGKKN